MPTQITPSAKEKPTAPPRLLIQGSEFHIERKESYYIVQFFDLDGKRQSMLVARELFTSPSKVVAQLLKANADLPHNNKAATRLVMRALADRGKRSRHITVRTGWHGESFVYPGETVGPLAGKLEHVGADEIDPALGLRNGTCQGWRDGLRNAFEASDYLIFAAGIAFSGPLFDLAREQEGVIFHFQPQQSSLGSAELKTRSTSGKTLAARVAISTIGRARKTDLVSFAASLRASEDYCFSHNNLVGVLDEEGRALSGTGRHIKPSQLPYQMTSGRGTLYSLKATRDPDIKNFTWLLPLITTGEKPLDDPNNQRLRTEGAQVRMAPAPVPPGRVGGILNGINAPSDQITEKAHVLAREVERTLAEHYGVAMPAYLSKLVAQRSSLEAKVRQIMDKFVKWVGADIDPWERRLAEKFGIVLAGAIFASKFEVAPWTERRAANAVRTIYRRSRAALASTNEATDSLIVKLRKASAAGRFPKLAKGETLKSEQAGVALGVTRNLAKHGPAVVISLDRLRSLIVPTAISKAVLNELVKRRMLIKSPDGKISRELMLRGLYGSQRRRLVALKLSSLVEGP